MSSFEELPTPDFAHIGRDTVFEDSSMERIATQQRQHFETSLARSLVEQARAGDTVAEERLVTHNLGLVFKMVRIARGTIEGQETTQSLDIADLVQEGVIGLLDSIRKVDQKNPEHAKNAFSSYPSIAITRAIQRAMINQGYAIRTPVDIDAQIRSTRLALRGARTALASSPTVEEVAKLTPDYPTGHLALSTSEYDSEGFLEGPHSEAFVAKLKADHEAAKAKSIKTTSEILTLAELRLPQSLDVMIEKDGYDQADPLQAADIDETTLDRMQYAPLKGALATLSYRERKVLELRYGLYGPEQIQEEIGKEFKISKTRVHQIQTRSLRKLQESKQVQPLRDATPDYGSMRSNEIKANHKNQNPFDEIAFAIRGRRPIIRRKVIMPTVRHTTPKTSAKFESTPNNRESNPEQKLAFLQRQINALNYFEENGTTPNLDKGMAKELAVQLDNLLMHINALGYRLEADASSPAPQAVVEKRLRQIEREKTALTQISENNPLSRPNRATKFFISRILIKQAMTKIDTEQTISYNSPISY